MNVLQKITLAWRSCRAWNKARKEAKVTKKHLQSLTVWGLILMVASTLKAKFGWEITETQIESALTAVLWIAGVIAAYLGRRRAVQPLKG